jgi:cytoskeleton protein RodZ
VSLFQRIKTPFTESGGDEMAPPRPRPRPVGEILRERREELELDLDRVGEILRIKPAYLAALEQGRPQDLPGPTYVIGFVRAYAHHLGLDGERVLERYKAESADVHTRPDLAFPLALGERSVPGGPILLVALILAICGYGTWYYLSTDERSRPERVAAVPPSLQLPSASEAAAPDPTAAIPAAKPGAAGTATANAGSANSGAAANPRLSSGLFPAPDTATPADTGGSAPSAPVPPASPAAAAPAVPASTTPVGPASPASATTARATAPPQQAAPVAPQQQAVAAAPQASPAETKPVDEAAAATAPGRIAIRATADCWIQVRAADQAIIFSRVLKSGETYQVPGRTGLFLRTGNAGALAITVDGKQTPSIGAIGTLRRNVALDPDELIGGTAVHG